MNIPINDEYINAINNLPQTWDHRYLVDLIYEDGMRLGAYHTFVEGLLPQSQIVIQGIQPWITRRPVMGQDLRAVVTYICRMDRLFSPVKEIKTQ